MDRTEPVVPRVLPAVRPVVAFPAKVFVGKSTAAWQPLGPSIAAYCRCRPTNPLAYSLPCTNQSETDQERLARRSWESTCGLCSATVTHVGTPACNPVSSNTNAVTYTPHATGDQIFLSIAALSTSSSLISSISDGESSSYAAAVSPAIGSAYSAYLWDTLSVNSGVTTITVHFASSVNNVVCVSEYSGGVELGNTGTPATFKEVMNFGA